VVYRSLYDFKNIKDVNLKAQKYTNIGACYHKLRLYEDARKNYNKAIDNDNKDIEINPKLVDAYYNLGVLNYDEGNVDTAKKLFESCLKTDSKFTNAKEALEKVNSNLTDTTEWFKWWFTGGIGKKVFGTTLIFSIILLIGIIMTTIIFMSYNNQIMALNNQTLTLEILDVNKDIISQAITATTILLIGLLILILLFPSIRRVKVGDIIELEPVTSGTTSGTDIPKHMEPLFIKIGFGMQSF
jgi:tetratricopeptide (TPR) repeat protein